MRGTPFLSHWKTGVSVTPLGREREQVRVTVAPAMTGDEGEEVSEMAAGSENRQNYKVSNWNGNYRRLCNILSIKSDPTRQMTIATYS